jgi:hypothetical protein
VIPRRLASGLAGLCAAVSVHAADTRTAVVVTAAERDWVLAEMREMVGAVRDMMAAAAANDMDRFAAAAESVGMERHDPPPRGLPGKLPAAFRQLGGGLHREFDQIARDVRAIRERDMALARVAENMSRCIACHQAWRVEVAQ